MLYFSDVLVMLYFYVVPAVLYYFCQTIFCASYSDLCVLSRGGTFLFSSHVSVYFLYISFVCCISTMLLSPDYM